MKKNLLINMRTLVMMIVMAMTVVSITGCGDDDDDDGGANSSALVGTTWVGSNTERSYNYDETMKFTTSTRGSSRRVYRRSGDVQYDEFTYSYNSNTNRGAYITDGADGTKSWFIFEISGDRLHLIYHWIDKGEEKTHDFGYLTKQ